MYLIRSIETMVAWGMNILREMQDVWRPAVDAVGGTDWS